MKITFLRITLYSLALHLFAIVFSSGFHHFDEHFQIYEFLNYKRGLTPAKDLPWEFHEKIRPWFQVSIYYYIQYFFSTIFGIKSPFIFATLFRFFTSLLGLFSVYHLIPLLSLWFKEIKHQKLAYFLLNFLWFIPYIHTRTNSESMGLSLFLIGLSFFIKSTSNQSFKSFFIAGLIFGFSYLTRSQMALYVATIWFWGIFVGRYKAKYLFATSLSIILVILAGIPIDYWGYTTWTFSTWNYFEANFVKGMMKSFGISPWWDYFRLLLLRGMPPISLPLMIATIIGWFKYKKHPITWITFSFFVFHSYLGHKELRFIFPIIALSPIYLALFFQEYEKKVLYLYKKKNFIRYLANFALGLNFIILVLTCFRPANPSVNFYKFIYDHPEITELFISVENPYTMLGLNINYYKRSNLLITKKEINLEKIKDLATGFHFFNKGKYIFQMENNSSCENIFMSYPRWVLNFNISNWISRSRVWSLYKCQ